MNFIDPNQQQGFNNMGIPNGNMNNMGNTGFPSNGMGMGMTDGNGGMPVQGNMNGMQMQVNMQVNPQNTGVLGRLGLKRQRTPQEQAERNKRRALMLLIGITFLILNIRSNYLAKENFKNYAVPIQAVVLDTQYTTDVDAYGKVTNSTSTTIVYDCDDIRYTGELNNDDSDYEIGEQITIYVDKRNPAVVMEKPRNTVMLGVGTIIVIIILLSIIF